MWVQPNDFRDRFAAMLRESRTAANMTQGALARAVGVHQPSVSAWEAGKTLPTPPTLIALAQLFDLDLSQLSDSAA